MLVSWDWPCFTKKGEKCPFQDPFKYSKYYRIENHGAVVGNVLWIAFFMHWAYNGEAPVSRYNRRCKGIGDKGSAKKSASQRILCGWMSSGPGPFEISKLESSLCTTGIENCGTVITPPCITITMIEPLWSILPPFSAEYKLSCFFGLFWLHFRLVSPPRVAAGWRHHTTGWQWSCL